MLGGGIIYRRRLRAVARWWPALLFIALMIVACTFDMYLPFCLNKYGRTAIAAGINRGCLVLAWHGGNGIFGPFPFEFSDHRFSPGLDLLPDGTASWSRMGNSGWLRLPLWVFFVPGFAALATVRKAVRAMRRRNLRNADRCGGCGYPAVGLPSNSPCPECGKFPTQ